MNFNDNDGAFLFVMGQSNAHAHSQMLDEYEKIKIPLKNVFTLERNFNQSFSNTEIKWSNFTSESYNLGETQDHTATLAYYFAQDWQERINKGIKLPNLYIVQISIGAEGIINGMWNMQKEKCLIPGQLGTANISLYSYALHIFSLVFSFIKENIKNPLMLGCHWIGSEQDCCAVDTFSSYVKPNNLSNIYYDFFTSIINTVDYNCPLYLYKIVCQKLCEDETFVRIDGIDTINNEFSNLKNKIKNTHIVETDKSPIWDENSKYSGIFCEDKIHYNKHTQKWFSDNLFSLL